MPNALVGAYAHPTQGAVGRNIWEPELRIFTPSAEEAYNKGKNKFPRLAQKYKKGKWLEGGLLVLPDHF